jgi:hypothetical protein
LFRLSGRLLEPESCQFAPYTVRIWSLTQGLHVHSLKTTALGRGFDWTYGRRILALLKPAPPAMSAKISLGVLTKLDNWTEVVDLCQSLSGVVGEVLVAVDAERVDAKLEKSLQEVCQLPARVFAHPLAGDFAAQRNRIQAASSCPWVLQLDTDERLTAIAKKRLIHLVSEAESSGWDAIALPRQNIVDNVVSAHYPDVQYRLLRKSVRFMRKVHEYPDLRGRRSIVALDADIRHTMGGGRLLLREQIYEAILPGGGRPYDTALLRMPLNPGWQLAS